MEAQQSPQSVHDSDTQHKGAGSSKDGMSPDAGSSQGNSAIMSPNAEDNSMGLLETLEAILPSKKVSDTVFEEQLPAFVEACAKFRLAVPPRGRDQSLYAYQSTITAWRNKLRMSAMGLTQAAEDVKNAAYQENLAMRKQSTQRRSRAPPEDSQPVRVSLRNQGKAPVNYADARIEGEAHIIERRSRCRGVSSSNASGYGLWEHYLRVAPPAPLQRACLAAAEAHAEELKELEQYSAVGCKIMSKSICAGGFWCQSPLQLSISPHGIPCGTAADKTHIYMVCMNEMPVDEDSSINYSCEVIGAGGMFSDTAWDVIWLPRINGAGFSGNWRGFSIAHQLQLGDAVLYALRKEKLHGKYAVDIYIHRVLDHMDDQQQAEWSKLAKHESREDLEAREEAAELLARKGAAADPVETDADEPANAEPERKKARTAPSMAAAPAATKNRRKASAPKAAPVDGVEVDKESAAVAAEPDKRPSRAAARSAVAAATEKLKGTKTASKAPAKAPTKAPATAPVRAPAPAAESDDEEEEFFPQHILGFKMEKGRPKFLIRWWNYGPAHDTWEPIDCLNAAPSAYVWKKKEAFNKWKAAAAKLIAAGQKGIEV